MKISELLSICKVDDSDLQEVLECHPKQIMSSVLEIPTWRITYSYFTQRNNKKEAIKYMFLHKCDDDLLDNEFEIYIRRFNEENPDRKLSNVEMLDCEYLGEITLELE